jgi:hypothetical protein
MTKEVVMNWARPHWSKCRVINELGVLYLASPTVFVAVLDERNYRELEDISARRSVRMKCRVFELHSLSTKQLF